MTFPVAQLHKISDSVSRHRWDPGKWHQAENISISIVVSLIVALPVIAVLFRAIGLVNFPAVGIYVQHLVLIVSLMGAAIAAREKRLLSLATASTELRNELQLYRRAFVAAVGATVCFFLAYASIIFIKTEIIAGTQLTEGIYAWWLQLIFPIGFGLIGVRLIAHSDTTLKIRLLSLAIAAAFIVFASSWNGDLQIIKIPALTVLIIATALGTPIFVTIAGAALILFWSDQLPIASIVLDHYRLVVNPMLPTIPLFTLAGYILAEGGAPKRLVNVFQQGFGFFRGGIGIATIVACAFFTSLTGASGVTILALGGILMPLLISSGYQKRQSLGWVTGAGAPGVLLPPSLPIILYAIVAEIGIRQMFLGSLLPALVMLGLAAIWAVRTSPHKSDHLHFDFQKTKRAIQEARWELMLPVIAIGALFSGLATPVEAAAITAMYALIIETFVYRDLHLIRDIPRVISECGLLVGGILLILGVAMGFTNYLVDARIPDQLVDLVTRLIENKWTFLLALNLFLLAVGCMMDIFSAIVVIDPLILPIGLAYGIDPIHLGVIFLANLELGYLTPPVGMNLFFSATRFGEPVNRVCRATLPLFFIFAAGVVIITYTPILSTLLPGLLPR